MPIDACHLIRELCQHPCALRQLACFRVKIREDYRRGQKQKKVERREGEVEAGFCHVDLPNYQGSVSLSRSPARRLAVGRGCATSLQFAPAAAHFTPDGEVAGVTALPEIRGSDCHRGEPEAPRRLESSRAERAAVYSLAFEEFDPPRHFLSGRTHYYALVCRHSHKIGET